MSQFLTGKFVANVVLMIFCASVLTVRSDEDCDTDVENMLNTIISPNEPPTIQIQALRRDIIRRLKDALQRQELEDELMQYKRSLSSLARWNNLPGKRNLESLARAGYIRTLPNENDTNFKRSIANMAKNGQLPHLQNDEYKRDVDPMAPGTSLTDPMDGDEFHRFADEDKRNVASLAREGVRLNGKRNVAALLRRDGYHVPKSQTNDDEKRTIASIKAQYKPKYKRSAVGVQRQKRDVDYFDDDEYTVPAYQNQNFYDYEDYIRDLAEGYPSAEKRFLGSVAKTGWFRPSSKSRFVSPSKRHIGSLARLGWLPAFRNVRRFSRSGRSTNDCDIRTFTTNGQAENNAISKNSLQLDEKRFLLQPAVDKILLEKVYLQPQIH